LQSVHLYYIFNIGISFAFIIIFQVKKYNVYTLKKCDISYVMSRANVIVFFLEDRHFNLI